MRNVLAAAVLALALPWPAPALAQSADNVLVVINDASQESVQIGEYYVHKRAVAQDHVVRLKTAVTEAINRAEYVRSIEQPVGEWLIKNSLEDKILYIVLTKGVPLRIDGTSGLQGTIASVDSELTLLYRRMVGTPVAPIAGRLPNPYFQDQKAVTEAKPLTRFASDIYLVTRLDGYTVDDVLKLIDRGAAPATAGKIVLDQRATLLDSGGDRWLEQTADRLRQSGASDRVVLEMTRALASEDGPVIGYFSWGSNDQANRLRHFGMKFVPGAIGAMFVSTDGRSFNEPPADWVPGGSDQRGYGSQSLAGDLIRDGITGVAAHVTEPLLDATIRPQILFPAYLAGFNLAEAFYLAMPFLSWQTVVIGDPLCTPFPRTMLTPSQIAKDIDPTTEFPALFGERRLAFLATGGLNVEAVKAAIRAEALKSRGNDAEAEKATEEAFRLEPRLSGAAVTLGAAYDARGDHAKAIETYRRALTAAPENVVLLNNLAYDLAEYQHDPTDALPLAEKAYGLARIATIADTLGWIHHLRGDDRLALPLIEQAMAAIKNNADVQIHAAFVYAALGDVAKAKPALDAALKLDPTLADREDVKALREKVK
ncbi:MAG TPA: TIGR03790 family protein [Vicinamibacterales bacterium]|nr:TIGR03790 family protein [Vicinamibacterales bacterium]